MNAKIPADAMDRYFDRQANLVRARQHACGFCGVETGQRCNDQWGLATSFVHPTRAAAIGWTDDPYPLAEVGRVGLFSTINRSGHGYEIGHGQHP